MLFWVVQAYHVLFLKYHIKDVVFGHAHRSFGDVKIGEVRLIILDHLDILENGI